MNLNPFKETNLFNAGTSFFKQLNIPLNSNTTTSLYLKDILKDKFKSQEIFEKVSETYFLGLVDKSVFADNLSLFDDGNVTFDQAVEKIHADYEGMMIFAVQIKGIASPTRTQLADLTRAFNRTSQSLPVVVLFQYGSLITLATSERTKYKQTWREGEKVGKVSLLRDIDIQNPHTGHLKILLDLVITPDARDFSGLYEQWREVFDVQLLNRNFYKELSTWYFWALRQVEFPDDVEKDRDIRNPTSVIRLITRLMFVWFLKEKNLVPDALFDKDQLDDHLIYKDCNNSTYYKAILQNLFFATLNTKMKKDDPQSRKFVNRQSGIQQFYRYQRFFKDKQNALKLFEDIPFLNGGLFENLDKNTGEPNEKRIDCFSNRPVHEKKLKVPDRLFFGDKEIIDISKELGTKKPKNEKVRGLIHILNSYKFTIDENTPIEEEIALDPELLGKVFENLLASYNPETQTTARKQTGSFYTPREIVDYMVDESLKASLSNLVSKKIDNATEDDIKTGLDILFEYTEKEHAFTDNEVSKIVEAISELKILDPACGSGAFPMGILHKLVFILNKIDGDNKKWRELQKQRAVKETEKAYSVGDKEERHQRLKEIEEAFDFNTSDYGRKLFLIENSIYGVDIQPIAVQIAKLRFFISLIVDQKTDEDKENLGILPLPNLETKFVAANTLIGVEKGLGNLFEQKIKEKERELAKVRQKHFSARTPKTKATHREKDKKLRAELAQLLCENENFGTGVAEQLAHWDPYDQNTSAAFFDPEWMFGLRTGFDITIGNPPYINALDFNTIYGNKLRRTLSETYKSARGAYDIFILFIERGINLLASSGVLSFITPNKYLSAKYAISLREFLLKTSFIYHLVDVSGIRVFEESAVYPVLTFLGKASSERASISSIRVFLPNTRKSEKFVLENFRETFVPAQMLRMLPENIWGFLLSHHIDFLPRLTSSSVPLKDLGEINATSTAAEADNYGAFLTNKSGSDMLKVVNTGTIDKFVSLWGHKELTHSGTKFLTPRLPLHKARVNERRRKMYKSPKIIFAKMAKTCEAFVDKNGEYASLNTNCFYMPRRDVDLKFIGGICNSYVFMFLYSLFFGALRMSGGYYQFQAPQLRVTPVAYTEPSKQVPIIKLVDEILSVKHSDPTAKTIGLEAEIDARVAHLYNLTEEEYSLILNETNCSDPFRVAALNVYRDIARGKTK